jgi:hypothetical protein
METIIGNQQDYNLSNNQIQVLLTGTFGDGCISLNKSNTSTFTSNGIHKEYIDFKFNLLEDLQSSTREGMNSGYKVNIIHSLLSKADKRITTLHHNSLENKLNLLDDLGLALWFYDDGSLHKKNRFFNLNTHSFSEEVHYDVLVPYFENKGLRPKVFKDRKKDGREFSYLYFGKHYGAFEIMEILQKYPLQCYSYKLWSSETIQEWSKLLVQLKSENKTISARKFSNILAGKSVL